MLTPERLAAIKKRLSKISPGQWRHCCDGDNPKCDHMVWADSDQENPVCRTEQTEYLDHHANAAFIANAPSDILELLGEVDRLSSALLGNEITNDRRIMSRIDLSRYVRDVPNFPKPGILFRDITPMLQDPIALCCAISQMKMQAEALRPDLVVAIESRGFLFGAPLADRLDVGFVPVRKPGKLPYRSIREEYDLEYGTGTLEMHDERLDGRRVLIVDDLLATGGTADCAWRLCQRLGATVVGFSFVVELTSFKGRDFLSASGRSVSTLLAY